MDIQTLAGGETGYAAWYDLYCVVREADRPDVPPQSRRAIYAALADGWPGETTEYWVVWDGDRLVGGAELTFPQLDNLENAWLELMVHPGHRRRGIGTALLAHCVERARAEGRRKLIADVIESLQAKVHRPGHDAPGEQAPPADVTRSPGRAAFAAKHGTERALEEVRRRLQVTAEDLPRLDAALAGAWTYAAGYSLLRWDESGAPGDAVADIAALDSDFINQAPMGDLAWEAEKVDVARTRQMEQAMRNRGWRLCHTAARHDASGEVVAWTTIACFGESDEHAWQLITLVRPDHRGHRLGTVVKLENFRYARERFPALRVIDTCNASVNDHMVAINELMGFRPVDLTVGWQLDV